jgi:hypothetical protein
MRSIRGYVAFLVVRHLSGRGNGRRRRKAAVSPRGQRVSYDIAVSLTPDQKAQLQARARDQVGSLASYVERLVVEELERG